MDKTVKSDFLGIDSFQLLRPRGSSKWKIWEDARVTVDSGLPYRDIGPLGFRELDKKGRIKRERQRAYSLRFGMALFGGVALIVPMVIMALYQGVVLHLVTASVATVIFAVIVAVSAQDAAGKDVVAATAAYAAVLVVFVGASQ